MGAASVIVVVIVVLGIAGLVLAFGDQLLPNLIYKPAHEFKVPPPGWIAFTTRSYVVGVQWVLGQNGSGYAHDKYVRGPTGDWQLNYNVQFSNQHMQLQVSQERVLVNGSRMMYQGEPVIRWETLLSEPAVLPQPPPAVMPNQYTNSQPFGPVQPVQPVKPVSKLPDTEEYGNTVEVYMGSKYTFTLKNGGMQKYKMTYNGGAVWVKDGPEVFTVIEIKSEYKTPDTSTFTITYLGVESTVGLFNMRRTAQGLVFTDESLRPPESPRPQPPESPPKPDMSMFPPMPLETGVPIGSTYYDYARTCHDSTEPDKHCLTCEDVQRHYDSKRWALPTHTIPKCIVGV